MNAKFVNLISKYLPKRYKLHPKSIDVFLDEDVDNITNEKFRYLVGNLNPQDEEIQFDLGDNNDVLKSQGVVKIDNEYIKYMTKDITIETLLNIERGFLETEAAAHCNSILWDAYLLSDIDEFTTTIPISRITNMSAVPKNGKFIIYTDTQDIEEILYTSYNQWLNGTQFINVTRGSGGTSAKKHPKNSRIVEYASPLITQVNTIKYDKGIFSVILSTNVTESSIEFQIKNIFFGKLESSIVNTDIEIKIYDIIGNVPKNGLLKIDNEIIRYGKFEVSEITPYSGTFKKLTRGFESSNISSHDADSVIYHTLPQGSEFLIDDEYVYYGEYDPINRKFKELTRGFYGSLVTTHLANTIITQRKNLEFEKTGLIKIDNEYFKYWYVDDDYFYYDDRPSMSGGNYYYTQSGRINSIVEYHDTGSTISTYYFDNDNSIYIDFFHTIAEHLDIALITQIDKFENFSDIDNIDIDYLKYLVSTIGENLDDYQNLPFFSGSNYESRLRTFTKELTSIYRNKGLLTALKVWHTVISQSLKNYQNLWTFNYNSFFSLPFLCLIIYEGSRIFYPSENFYKPQISKKLYEEIAYFYRNKKLYNKLILNLKLTVSEWNYFQKMDDDVKSSNGGKFDDKIIPSDSINDLNVYHDPTKVSLQERGTSNYYNLPFFFDDYNLDIFKFEEELDSDKDNTDDPNLSCFPIATDYGLKSDELSDWIMDEGTELIDYCDPSDRLFPIKTDVELLKDYNYDLGNAKLQLVNNIDKNDVEIVVKLISGKLYSPYEHIAYGTNPKIKPKGYIKIEDEIISYQDLEFFDEHDGTFINKKYKLLNCERGINGTSAADYKINLYQGHEYLLHDRDIEEVILPDRISCSVDILTNILTHSDHGLETNDIVIFEKGNGAGVFVNTYYLVYKINNNEFQIKNINTGALIVIGSTEIIFARKINFRLTLYGDPNTYNVSVGDYIEIVQSNGYDKICEIVNVESEYDYCANSWIYGIDFETIYPPDFNYKSVSNGDVYNCLIDGDTSIIYSTNHGFSDGDLIYFLKAVGNIDSYSNYYIIDSHPDYFRINKLNSLLVVTSNPITDYFTTLVDNELNEGDYVVFSNDNCGVMHSVMYRTINVSTYSFQILDSSNNVVNLIAGSNSFISYINLEGIKDQNNQFMENGVRILSTIDSYQHRYSLIQHILWRLENEINGNDLELTYSVNSQLLENYKLNTYKGINDSIIWPTPHFLYGIEATGDGTDGFPPDDIVQLILKKIKEYKPKHTVADITLNYSLDGTELGLSPLNENFETEILKSDAYIIGVSDPLEYHIELDSDPLDGIIDYEYNLPIITTDDSYDYGHYIGFYYKVHKGTTNELNLYYGPFVSYPPNGIVKTDSYRRRKRYFSWLNS